MVAPPHRLVRGDVWWADLDEPTGRRPVVLVSRQSGYQARELMLVVPVTTRVRALRTEVLLGLDEGLPRPCVANADTIMAINRARLLNRAGVLSAEKRAALDDALRFALDL